MNFVIKSPNVDKYILKIYGYWAIAKGARIRIKIRHKFCPDPNPDQDSGSGSFKQTNCLYSDKSMEFGKDVDNNNYINQIRILGHLKFLDRIILANILFIY